MKIFAFFAAALAVAVPQAAAKPGHAVPVMALAEHGSTSSLVKLDGMTLEPLSAQIPLGPGATVLARSPVGGRVAVATGNNSWLRFADLSRLRAGTYLYLGGYGEAALWTQPTRLVVLIGGESGYLKVIDTRRNRLVRSRLLGGQVIATARTPSALVLLLAPPGQLGPARLAVVDGSARVRTVALRGIQAGWAAVMDGANPVVHADVPGLAVDPSGKRAAVVTASGAGATVELATLSVRSYESRTLARARKEVRGAVLSATWFAPNLIAVTGEDAVGDEEWTPRGLKILDTRDWTMRLVDRGVTSTALAGETLLAFGAVWDWHTNAWVAGAGVSGFDAAGSSQYHLFGSTPIDSLTTVGSWAYVGSGGGRHFTVVDAAAGVVAGEAATAVPTSIVGAW